MPTDGATPPGLVTKSGVFFRPTEALLVSLELGVLELMDHLDAETAAAGAAGEVEALRIRARQCHTALRACQRTCFAPDLVAKLVLKVRNLQRDAARLFGEDEVVATFFGPATARATARMKARAAARR